LQISKIKSYQSNVYCKGKSRLIDSHINTNQLFVKILTNKTHLFLPIKQESNYQAAVGQPTARLLMRYPLIPPSHHCLPKKYLKESQTLAVQKNHF
jgi:hypothetical protein